MLNIRQLFGQAGEKLAVRHLRKLGYKIIETNYRNAMGEIDIVATDNDVIVFVEVKTRRSNSCVHPKEAVTRKKQSTISRVAKVWLKKKNKIGSKARFDVVSILSDNQNHDIELIKNAFNITTK